MAIRFVNPASFGAGVTGFCAGQVSGWRCYIQAVPGVTQVPQFFLAFASSVPNALSRPGNLGTAYIGVWTGNRSAT